MYRHFRKIKVFHFLTMIFNYTRWPFCQKPCETPRMLRIRTRLTR